jgi:hypothetical protein
LYGAGSGHRLVVREGGFEFLGPTVSEGDMQHLREAAKVKNTAGKFKINGQQVQMHAFYNALQANGGAVQAVRLAIRLMAVAIKLSNMCLLSKAASQKPVFSCRLSIVSLSQTHCTRSPRSWA